MDGDMPAGFYDLQVDVVDATRNPVQNARSHIKVEVRVVPEIAFQNHATIRLEYNADTPIDSFSFLYEPEGEKSRLTRFKEYMERLLREDKCQVDVFSIKKSEAILQTSYKEVIDIRFTVQTEKGFLSPVLLNGLLAQYQSDIEQEIDARILGVGIDMCKLTHCDNGCQTVNRADTFGVMVDANNTAIVGVNASAHDECSCPVFLPPSSCDVDVCYNDGVCHNTYPGTFCECRNSNLNGFRCQGNTRSFNGAGFAWFKPMPACTSLNISLNFMTREDGLLLYNGPMRRTDKAEQKDVLNYQDFLSIYIKDGMPMVDLQFNGQATVELKINSIVTDGRFHQLTLSQQHKNLEFVLDECATLTSDVNDASECRIFKIAPDDDERLNIVTPLQLGGLAPLPTGVDYPEFVSGKKSLNGCIRKLVVNNDHYDLYNPVHYKNSVEGCSSYWGNACQVSSADATSNSVSASNNYCLNGECYAEVENAVPNVFVTLDMLVTVASVK
uniref:Uncharacterized protein n=1 Tax=Ditylenchus dipsaci TaxID=166011 RepID=A0A915E448_9BILA